MKKIETAAEKAKVTTAIRAYIDAKNAEKAANAEAKKRQKELLEVLDGDKELDWETDDGRKYHLTATYGKTRSSLSKELIEKLFNITITDACYVSSNPWDELRATIVS